MNYLASRPTRLKLSFLSSIFAFGAESFLLRFANRTNSDTDTQNDNFACFSVYWVRGKRFGPQTYEVTREWRRLHNEEHNNQIKENEMGGACGTYTGGERRGA